MSKEDNIVVQHRSTPKYADLTAEQRIDVENRVKDAGYLVLEEGKSSNTAVCREVVCPLCNNPLEVYTSGNSYQISCCEHGRVVTLRAYANPNFT